MLDNIKIGTKLIAGFFVVLIIAAIIGVMGVNGLSKLDSISDEMYQRRLLGISHIKEMNLNIIYLQRALRNVILAVDEAEVNRYMQNIEIFDADFNRFLDSSEARLTTEQGKKLAKDLRDDSKTFIGNVHNMANIARTVRLDVPKQISEQMAKTAPIAAAMDKNATELAELFESVALKANEDGTKTYHSIRNMLIMFLIIGVIFGVAIAVFLSNSITKPIGQAVKMIGELGAGHLGMRLKLTRQDEVGQMAKSMDSFADDLQNVVVGTMKKISEGDLSTRIELKDDKDEIMAALKNTIVSLRQLIIDDGGKVLQAAAEKDLSKRLTCEYKGAYATMKDNINAVIKSLDEALTQVTEAVGQVTGASGEIASGSQSLAEGSNEQASSLEEVSSSLEEMSSMTKQNADNSNQAKILAAEARSAADEGDASMKRMAEAIHQIKQSSDNTAKIIKTIDDIAFQTNLLALNAAVEAARAGDAGKGFAVVAEEVRSLAMRSAEAAKNTQNMIEESVKNSEGGVKITEEVAKSLGQIVDRTSKVGDLIAEIAAASNEQAQGIEQVNTAVAQMNQVTQSNAANSEESASAAEELNSQASELANMVSAFKLSGSGSAPRSGSRRGLPPPPAHNFAALPDKRASKPKTTVKPKAAGKAVRAEEVIPLDDSELSEF